MSSEILELKNEILELKQMILDIKKSTNNMDKHISFVENVYLTLKIPLEFIKTNIEKIIDYGVYIPREGVIPSKMHT